MTPLVAGYVAILFMFGFSALVVLVRRFGGVR